MKVIQHGLNLSQDKERHVLWSTELCSGRIAWRARWGIIVDDFIETLISFDSVLLDGTTAFWCRIKGCNELLGE